MLTLDAVKSDIDEEAHLRDTPVREVCQDLIELLPLSLLSEGYGALPQLLRAHYALLTKKGYDTSDYDKLVQALQFKFDKASSTLTMQSEEKCIQVVFSYLSSADKFFSMLTAVIHGKVKSGYFLLLEDFDCTNPDGIYETEYHRLVETHNPTEVLSVLSFSFYDGVLIVYIDNHCVFKCSQFRKTVEIQPMSDWSPDTCYTGYSPVEFRKRTYFYTGKFPNCYGPKHKAYLELLKHALDKSHISEQDKLQIIYEACDPDIGTGRLDEIYNEVAKHDS